MTEPTSVHSVNTADLRIEQAELVLPEHIPARYRTAHVEDRGVAAWVDQVVNGETGSLLLAGEIGTGKTHHAYAALAAVVRGRAALGQSCQPAAATHSSVVVAARPDGEGIHRFITADVLVLDDLGSANVTIWNVDVVYQVIDTRWAEMLPTIYTTNFDPDTLADRLGARITSRLFGMCRTVILNGPDRRQQ
jgi:DNA replication protein DnaC